MIHEIFEEGKILFTVTFDLFSIYAQDQATESFHHYHHPLAFKFKHILSKCKTNFSKTKREKGFVGTKTIRKEDESSIVYT